MVEHGLTCGKAAEPFARRIRHGFGAVEHGDLRLADARALALPAEAGANVEPQHCVLRWQNAGAQGRASAVISAGFTGFVPFSSQVPALVATPFNVLTLAILGSHRHSSGRIGVRGTSNAG